MRVLHYSLIILLCSAFPALATGSHVDEELRHGAPSRHLSSDSEEPEDEASQWRNAITIAHEFLADRDIKRLTNAFELFCENSTDEQGNKRYEPGSYDDFMSNLPNDVKLGSKEEASLEARYRIASCTAALSCSALESATDEIGELLFDPLLDGLQERVQVEQDGTTTSIRLKE